MKNQPIRDDFLEKRKARQRKARKKRLITGLIISGIALFITLIVLCLTVFFPIAKITVSGSNIYTQEQVIKNSGIKLGDNIFTFGEKNATNNLRSQLPFIEKVEYIREFPDSLKIKITDAKPYYCVYNNGYYYNVSESGWVLEKVSEKSKNVFEIKLKGVKCTVGKEIVFNDKKSQKRFENILKLLNDNKLKINYIDVTNSVELKVGVEDRFDVNIGTENFLENKIKHLKVTINKIAPNKSGTINLSVWSDQKPQATFVENNTK